MEDSPEDEEKTSSKIHIGYSYKGYIIIPEDTSIFNYNLFDIDDFIRNIGDNDFYVRVIIPIYDKKNNQKKIIPEYLIIIKCKRRELGKIRGYFKVKNSKKGNPTVEINIIEKPGNPEIILVTESSNGEISRVKMQNILSGKVIIIKNPEKEDLLNAIFDSLLIILYAIKRGKYGPISVDGMIDFFKIQKELEYNYHSERIITKESSLPSISKGDDWHKKWDIYLSELIGKNILEFRALINLLCAERVLKEKTAKKEKGPGSSSSKNRMEGIPVAIVNISKEDGKNTVILKIYNTDIHNPEEIFNTVVNLPLYIRRMKHKSIRPRNKPPSITISCDRMKRISDRYGVRGCARCPHNGIKNNSVNAYILHISRWFTVTEEGKKQISELMSDISRFIESIFGVGLEDAVENYFFALDRKLPLIL